MSTVNENKKAFSMGLRHGLPIGLGYLAVSFSLGIAAKKAGLTPLQGLIASLTTNASAGEYAAFQVIGAAAPYIEMVLAILVANARYLLMATALSQKFSPKTKLIHRIIVGFDITDELFGINIARPGYLNPRYSYGAMVSSMPFWAAGTALGIIVGNILPFRLVSALSVALYAMFIAIIIPPATKNRVIAVIIIISFAASYVFSTVPVISGLSAGTRTIILTVIISFIAALKFPVREEAARE